MTTALLYKEFRETLPIAVVGLACLLLVALEPMGYSPLPNWFGGRSIGALPFVGYSDQFPSYFRMLAGGLALALGFWHALGDFWGEAHLFLLHRPVQRRSIYATKLMVGLVAYLLCAAAPIVLYGIWAATPGTHASPFEWSMTLPVWESWFAMLTIYLGAFLSGLRPGAWVGTRLAPLAAAAGVLAVSTALWWLSGGLAIVVNLAVLLAANIALAMAILDTAEARDFG
jgi:hypothetical protein